MKLFSALVFLLSLGTFVSASNLTIANPYSSLNAGEYKVGYTRLSVKYASASTSQKEINLLLNIWYPTLDTTANRMKVTDYATTPRTVNVSGSDSLGLPEINELRNTLRKWFGEFTDENWQTFLEQPANAFINARFHQKKFPLILGRLRVFSTTHTNEFLASHGYIVCMLTPVDDFPPDNQKAYRQQLSDEISYFVFIKKYLNEKAGITNSESGLFGFSGNGISPFLTPMLVKEFNAVALFESGIYLKDIHEIIRKHPGYSEMNYPAAIIMFYNRHRFDQNMQQHFDRLAADKKYLIQFDGKDQHHWDFASEGTIASEFLNNRTPESSARQLKQFQTMNLLLVDFFDQYLKNKDSGLQNQVVVN